MGLTVKSTTSSGDFEVDGARVPLTLRYKTEAQERSEKNIPEDRYLEASIMINNRVKGDTIIGMQPFWAIFTKTTPEKLEANLNRARKELEPVSELKVVRAIETAQKAGMKITNILVLGTGSMHVGGICVCCEHDPGDSAAQIAEALDLSIYFGIPPSPLSLAVQDPAYSKMEKKFLESKAIKVLDDPDAFASINCGTLLIAPGAYWSMFHTISQGHLCRHALPAAILASDVPAAIRKSFSDTSANSSAELRQNVEVLEMFEKYERVGFHDEDLEESIGVGYRKRGRRVKKETREAKMAAPCLFVRKQL